MDILLFEPARLSEQPRRVIPGQLASRGETEGLRVHAADALPADHNNRQLRRWREIHRRESADRLPCDDLITCGCAPQFGEPLGDHNEECATAKPTTVVPGIVVMGDGGN